ncbi:hypothetical protein BDZ85DRAFT_10874 [Elsinoe ampelina]|uniref:Uncharacterized protein n=1 Tax=Elsinoe ampelina TaxID=302913 RepID=A0A6A6GQP5_9PEZI|nr:hypothetical protein BDZ85DRAFT_10874 [Elsinoe ampelina]
MKSFAILLAGLLQSATAFKVHIVSDPNLVTVGDANIFKMTWEKVYALPGNEQAVSYTLPEHARVGNCREIKSTVDSTVTVEVDSLWGISKDIPIHETREAIMQSFQRYIEGFAEKENYKMFDHCLACPTPQDGHFCRAWHWGTKLPASVKVLIADHAGHPTGDYLHVRFSSTRHDKPGGGCGVAGAVASGLAGLLPGAAALFSVGIDIACEAVE